MDSEEAERRRDDAHHYAHYMVDSEDKKGHKPHKFTTHGLMDRLLRKTVGKNTWIYVSSLLYYRRYTYMKLGLRYAVYVSNQINTGFNGA